MPGGNMAPVVLISALLWATLSFLTASAQGTPTSSACPEISPAYAAPVVATGWEAKLVATGLDHPRSILFDSNGHLLVLQAGSGIVNLEFTDGGGTCVTLARTTNVVNSTELNHGIALSNDSKTLYASSVEAVFSWSYDAASRSVSSANQTVIFGMNNTDHTTRTLLMSNKQPGVLLVSRGSASNIDGASEDISTGQAQIKAFDMSNTTESSPPYDFTTSGRLLGWGLRNSVGIAEEPVTGGIYSVENSADDLSRLGTDIHQNNPGEEMNFHGFLNGTGTPQQGGNYGYPTCFALWDLDIPAPGALRVGQQFTPAPNGTLNDSTCASTRVPPRLTFQAHMAPLDLLFDPDGATAYISFHGSWDRAPPTGYKVSTLAFARGRPRAPPDSQSALTDLFTNADVTACPDSCFRPVGLARDALGRIFVSSDATGEIWLLRATGADAAAAAASTGGTTTTITSSSVSTGTSGSAAVVVPTSVSTGTKAAQAQRNISPDHNYWIVLLIIYCTLLFL